MGEHNHWPLTGSGQAFLGSDQLSWKRVSPRYLKLRLIQLAAVTLGSIVLCLLLFQGARIWNWTLPLWLILLVGAQFCGQILLWIILPRQIRSWGYAEREEHVLIVRGLLVRRLIVVPYGRMQRVTVSNGPLEGMLKLATLELETASVNSKSVIAGLDRQEADRLREVLTARGQEQMLAL